MNKRVRLLRVLAVAIVVALSNPPPTEAQTNLESIEDLTKDILLKDIELERFNIKYRQKSNVQGRWRGHRYFLSQEANNALTMAGLFDAVAKRYPAIDTPRTVSLDGAPSKAEIERSFVPQLLGQIIAASGSALELGINKYHDRQASQEGLSHQKAYVTALKFKSDIGDLFEKRGALIAESSDSLTQSDKNMLEAQTTLLRDLTDLSLDEFARFYVGNRRFRAFQDSLYILDVAKNTVGAVGNIVAMRAIDHNKPKLNGPAGVCTLVSGALITANPYLSRTVGWTVCQFAEYRTWRLRRNQHDMLKKIDDDIVAMKMLMPTAHEPIAQALSADAHGEMHAVLGRRKLELADREFAVGTRSASENLIAGTVIGMTKMSLGICSMVVGYRTYNKPALSNKLLYAGAISYGVGSAIGVADNIRIQVRSELEHRSLKAHKMLSGQILSDHLTALDTLESDLKKAN